MDKQFLLLASRIKAARIRDRDTLAIQVEATEAWKEANEELTNLNKEMDSYLNTIRNNATAIEISEETES
jgi:hypothetical protein